tara:strand:- start:78 stop:254 length:177 start_codon:yes stop_codon:yes gene_type:complete
MYFRARIFVKNNLMKNQDNGNVQLNSVRNEFNDRVEAKSYLGRSKKITWSGVRRFRSI